MSTVEGRKYPVTGVQWHPEVGICHTQTLIFFNIPRLGFVAYYMFLF